MLCKRPCFCKKVCGSMNDLQQGRKQGGWFCFAHLEHLLSNPDLHPIKNLE